MRTLTLIQNTADHYNFPLQKRTTNKNTNNTKKKGSAENNQALMLFVKTENS